MSNKMQNSSVVILKAVALTVAVMLALCTLVEYGTADYQARASERQALLDNQLCYK